MVTNSSIDYCTTMSYDLNLAMTRLSYAIYIVLMMTASIGNSFVTYVLLNNHNLEGNQHKFILSLSLTDLILLYSAFHEHWLLNCY